MLYNYAGTVISDLDSIKYFIDGILNEITKHISDEEIMFDLRLILNELVINGALHGNKSEKTKLVRLEICLEKDKLKIKVEDEGNGIIENSDEKDIDELKCCGRGLLIVDRLSDEFLINKNKFMVVKRIV